MRRVRSFQCPLCGHRCGPARILAGHLLTLHRDVFGPLCICCCGRKCGNIAALGRHLAALDFRRDGEAIRDHVAQGVLRARAEEKP